MSFAVVLPASRTPDFPDCCVACGAAGPDAGACIAARSAVPGLRVPACRACARRIERDHRWREPLLIGGAVLGSLWFAAVFVLVGAFWISLAGVLLGILGPALWLWRSSPAFTTSTVYGATSYEFARRAPAEAFAAANGTALRQAG